MPYIRHRNRMVHMSVIEDVTNLLTSSGWMGGTLLPLISSPVRIVEYIPEDAAQQGKKLEPNTFAIDAAAPSDMEEFELGGAVYTQPYKLAMAFYAESDAVGASVMQDLADRYNFLLSPREPLVLYDYSQTPKDPVQNLDIESFVYLRSPIASPNVNSFWLSELQVEDYVEPEQP